MQLGAVDSRYISHQLRGFRCADADSEVMTKINGLIIVNWRLVGKANRSGRPSCRGSPGARYAVISACIISVRLASAARSSPVQFEGMRMRGVPPSQNKVERTSIGPRTKQALLLACKERELNIAVEFDTLPTDGTCDGQHADSSRAIIVAPWCSCASEGTTAVVVPADENSRRGLFDRFIAAVE